MHLLESAARNCSADNNLNQKPRFGLGLALLDRTAPAHFINAALRQGDSAKTRTLWAGHWPYLLLGGNNT